MLSAAFGLTALALAVVGLYGVVSRRTADRRQEFGVRMALGARPADVGGLVLRDAGLLIGCGLAIGLPAAYTAAQVTGSLLFGVSSSSPSVFALTSGLARARRRGRGVPARPPGESRGSHGRPPFIARDLGRKWLRRSHPSHESGCDE